MEVITVRLARNRHKITYRSQIPKTVVFGDAQVNLGKCWRRF